MQNKPRGIEDKMYNKISTTFYSVRMSKKETFILSTIRESILAPASSQQMVYCHENQWINIVTELGRASGTDDGLQDKSENGFLFSSPDHHGGVSVIAEGLQP
ncbi:E3 Ubiquitin Ligase Traf3Ip2 [Manis pentadactyla]|nr:E3 Ubiquitin Ligase Traf3Ip2 [Manis pentadactyla]